jgi:mannosyltransferase
MRSRLRPESLLVVGVLLLAALLRFYALDGTSLWSDEGNTWALIQRSFGQIAQDAAADIHPPGYYWALKLWSNLFGVSVIAMRAFSALIGVALVWVIFRLGLFFDQQIHLERTIRWSALLAASLAALNPFQIYYSQEARMYMLLALESAGLFWALFALLSQTSYDRTGARRWLSTPAVAFVVCGIAGLWTHYSFPIVLVAAGATFLVDWTWTAPREQRRRARDLASFALLSALIVAGFLPWLPTALASVLTWPQGGEAITFADGARLTIQTLLFGPLRNVPEPSWPWLLAGALLPVVGMVAWREQRFLPGLAFWLFAPVGLMFGLGLFSDAFLKFLLVASAPWCLLSAGAGDLLRPRWPLRTTVAVFGLLVALFSLPGYYGAETARDNYAGIARYVAALGDPERDLVLLNAPGQLEVWSYYDPGVPVLALPAERPAEQASTEAALAAATTDKRNLYALFWATDEADPRRLVENWLDANAFKGPEQWQGNLRFVTYALPDDALVCTSLEPPIHFGESMALTGWCRNENEAIEGGNAAHIALQWRGLADMAIDYKVSVQLLDGARQVIAQHDSEPAGGSLPTSTWSVEQAVTDNHGLFIPLGTPPAAYRLTVAVYDPTTGSRLPTATGDSAELGELAIALPAVAPPPDVLAMDHRVNQLLGPVMLVGYDQHKLGFAHAPDTPLVPGDTVEFVFYWQAPDPLPADWPVAQMFHVRLGDSELTSPLAGASLPTVDWRPGQLIRTTVQLPYEGSETRARLKVGEKMFDLAYLPTGSD